jgi:zinc/manganese transport system substrate-binding protein
MENKTPEEFSEAIEEGSDAPAAVVAETEALLTGRQVKALLYNSQATGPQTEELRKAADQNGIPVIPLSETLPDGKDYVTWMTDNLTRLTSAVA